MSVGAVESRVGFGGGPVNSSVGGKIGSRTVMQ